MTRRFQLIAFVLAILPTFGCAGCVSHVDTLSHVRSLYYGGQLDNASAEMVRAAKSPLRAKERDVFQLNQATIDLVAGRPREAERKFRDIRDRFDYLEQKDAGEIVLAMFNDDTSLSYPGEDYEKVLLRAFLALSNLMSDGADARAYGHQIAMKQDQIVEAGRDKRGDNPKLAYKRVALGPYLCGILDEADYSLFGGAQPSYERLVLWAPEFRPGHEALHRAVHGRHSEPGNGVIHVFALTGRGPYKIEVNEENTQIGLLVAEFLISATNRHSVTPSLAPVKVPNLVASPGTVRTVGVAVNGQPVGLTETITDVTTMAIQQFEATYPRVVGRAIARRAIKKATLYGTKEAVQANPWVGLAVDVGGIAWEATENADTRCWGLLPDRIQVRRIELPAGQHRLGLSPVDFRGFNGPIYEEVVDVYDGRNTYVLACFPDAHLIGQIVHNTP